MPYSSEPESGQVRSGQVRSGQNILDIPQTVINYKTLINYLKAYM